MKRKEKDRLVRIPIGTSEHPIIMRIYRKSLQPTALFSDTANEMIAEYGAKAVRVKHLLNGVPYLSFVTREEAGKQEDSAMLTPVTREAKKYKLGSKKIMEEILLEADTEVRAEPLIDVVLVPMKTADPGSLIDMEIRSFELPAKNENQDQDEDRLPDGMDLAEDKGNANDIQKCDENKTQKAEEEEYDTIRVCVEKLSSGYVLRDNDGWSECFESEKNLLNAITERVDHATVADDYDLGYILEMRIKPVATLEGFYDFMKGGSR